MTFISVLLPAPFSPMSACTSPWRSSRSTPSSAMVGPKDLEIFDSLSPIILKNRSYRTYWTYKFLSFQGVVERVGGFHARAFVRAGDCQDSHAVVGWKR